MLRVMMCCALCVLAAPAGSAWTQNGSGGPEPFPAAWYLGDQDTLAIRRLEGKSAPELRAAQWVGPSRTLHEMRGSIVVIDFWAEWCRYCMPCLNLDQEIHRRYADRGVEVVAIHDGDRPGGDAWRRVASDHGLTFSHALDLKDAKMSTIARYGVRAFPTYVIVDRNGIIRAAGIRPDRVESAVQILLGEKRSAVKVSEFPPELFVGRENRLSRLRDMETMPAPQLQGDEWINGPIEIRIGGEITLIQFFSPTIPKSLEALRGLAARQAEFASKGARLVGVATSSSDWQMVRELAQEESWGFPVMRDRRTDPAGTDGLSSATANPFSNTTGRTADAYAADPVLPTVVVDRGGVIRASGFRWERAGEIVHHIAVHPSPAPYTVPMELPSP